MARPVDQPRAAPPTDRRIPLAALLLGVASLIPFVAAAAAATLASSPTQRLYGYVALISYSACVISFLGAIHAGAALREAPLPGARLAAAAIAPLLAWLALALGERNGLTMMAATLLLVLAYDITAARRGWVAPWYPRLRWPLTGVMLVSLLAARQFGPI
ncbi:DUF3429 domain-containing protein [Reyranella sp. CPCC 100927]|uniref:DUF3429 domain-containing protein n=1 Tax=Reyranella sp. CPCC 100927 TaxID=2599616 RepID=UPI0011B37056|nr:DUF3429 domain-containing protein [Reyranella sp. CPCC 100927]TWS95840.1 DUF3429 domain-containing protein [Reyranella sp. CPCC 100927]